MRHFFAFVSAVAGDWVGRMSGGVGLLLTVASFFTPPAWQPRAFVGAGVLCVLFAGYRVWLLERTAAEELLARLTPLDIYLIDGHIRRRQGDPARLFVFRVLLPIEQEASNAITDLRLTIEYGRGQGPLSSVAIAHRSELVERIPHPGTEAIRLPCPVGARTAVGGLALFDAPGDLIRDARIESYTLQVVDIQAREASVEYSLLREVSCVIRLRKKAIGLRDRIEANSVPIAGTL